MRTYHFKQNTKKIKFTVFNYKTLEESEIFELTVGEFLAFVRAKKAIVEVSYYLDDKANDIFRLSCGLKSPYELNSESYFFVDLPWLITEVPSDLKNYFRFSAEGRPSENIPEKKRNADLKSVSDKLKDYVKF